MSKRRKYSPEFKREAVQLARQPDVSCAQVARDFLRDAATFFAKESSKGTRCSEVAAKSTRFD